MDSYARIRQQDGTTVTLKITSESDRFLIGTHVNEEGDEIVPKGRDARGRRFTERTYLIDKKLILSRTPLTMNNKYGTLEPVGEALVDRIIEDEKPICTACNRPMTAKQVAYSQRPVASRVIAATDIRRAARRGVTICSLCGGHYTMTPEERAERKASFDKWMADLRARNR